MEYSKGYLSRFVAILLLAIYLPMLIGMALHIHKEKATITEVSCEENCTHKCNSHHGHLLPQTDESKCLLCCFFQLVYSPIFLAFAVSISFLISFEHVLSEWFKISEWQAKKSTRAPPYFNGL